MNRPCLAVLALGAALAIATPAAAADPNIAFEKYKLANGLTVILSEDHRTPQVAVNVWYHVGAANQTVGKSGFAHLFEHMMFSGSKHLPKGPFSVLEKIGTVAGPMANGTTSNDRTNYFETVPSSELPTALWVESDRMGFLLDTLDEKKLAIQRDVVSNERRQSYENRPYGMAQLALCDNLYPKPHPYYNCVIGTVAEIQSASMEDLKSFFRQFYGPSNASLAIVGDFDSKTAKRLVEQYFGPLPTVPPVPRPSVPAPKLTATREVKVEDKLVTVPRLIVAWPGVKPLEADEPPLDVAAVILGQGKTSRLYRHVVFEQQLASEVYAFNGSLGLGGFFEVGLTARGSHTVKELLPALDADVKELKEKGVTQEEVDRAVRNIQAGFLRSVEKIGGFGGKADTLNNYEMWAGDPGYLGKDLARYRAVTPAAVQAAAKKYLTAGRVVLDVEPAAAASTTGSR